MDALGPREFVDMLVVAAGCLEAKAAEIDALNVFPIPDGDTGTNMLLTMRSALRGARTAAESGAEATAEALARGALLGARGNSGVILSQFLVGIAEAVRGAERVGCLELARAFRRGSELAYAAVSRPVEGTMLTVMREASDAVRPFEQDQDLSALLEEALRGAGEALARTPQLLPELGAAGVVDAGGQGLYTLLEGACLYARGQREPLEGEELHMIPPRLPAGASGRGAAPGSAATPEPASFGFCVEFVLDHGTHSVEQVTGLLAAHGSSLVVAGARRAGRLPGSDAAPIRVHIHSSDPEGLLRRAAALGSLEQVQLRDMTRQHALYEHRRGDPRASSAPEVVAVVPGAGLARVFLSLGAAVVTVAAGSPSAQELLDAVDSASAADVIVLPNHRNIVPVAEQARRLSAKRVTVVPAATIPQGVAAMVAFAGEGDAKAAAARMDGALAGVHSVEVCRAVREAHLNGVRVDRDQHTGYLDGELVAACSSAGEAVREVLRRLPPGQIEVLTLYHGVEVQRERAEELAAALREDYPGVGVEVVSGGQPLYDYLVGVE
jgi:DAK2 domain fusion protein YloV